ncbi:hypothetical protein SSX86_002470 [Deinandra increscens subsp. villosa]|uniref:Uncharacterized protein n=1 Tax=Deinandra increscens subsp. villosa TaxID=3103831 RepID=A0AAP0DWG6_9ASTR
MNSNTYHPGLRNHPNFRYGNPANQANPNFQGTNQSNMAPRQPYANQGNFRGGNNQGYQRQYQQGNEPSGSSAPGDASGSEVMDILKTMQQEMHKRNQMDDERLRKDEVRDKAIHSLTTQMGQLATEVADLKKNKGQLPSDTVVNPKNTKQVHINMVSVVPNIKFNETCLTSPCQVVADIGETIKEKRDEESGAPIVPIRVGKLKISRALLDYGATMSVLPGSLYDLYDFGPLHVIDSVVSLADETWKKPRGVVKDVMIQLGEFQYLVDFLVLDYASTKAPAQHKVILGRPFLHTANAQINCRDDIITMTLENRKLFFNAWTKSITYESAARVGESCVFDTGVLPYIMGVCEGAWHDEATASATEGKPPDLRSSGSNVLNVDPRGYKNYTHFSTYNKFAPHQMEKHTGEDGRGYIFKPP